MSIVQASAIIFDLDGVLANSIPIVEESWGIWIRERGLNYATVMAVAHGRRKGEILAIVAPELDPVPEIARLTELETDRVHSVLRVPGAREFVAKLPVGKWAIATSGERPGALARLNAVGVPAPAVLVSAEDVAFGKPNPEVYLKAAAGIGALPAECLVFEDAPAGVEAARAAGMTAIAVLTTYPASSFPHAHGIIGDFTGVSVQSVSPKLVIAY